MSFENAQMEIRDRFSEANSLLIFLRGNSPGPLQPADNNSKSLRGLWIVSLYAAVERSVNVAIESALAVISSHNNKSIDCIAPIHSIFHFNQIKSVHECGRNKVFDKSITLFEASLSDSFLSITDNPLAESLQNVDANTMRWALKLFGAPQFIANPASIGRINALRERRNAVAHGRESASDVGERYTLDELTNIYNAADEIVTAFFMSLQEYCDHQRYLKSSA